MKITGALLLSLVLVAAIVVFLAAVLIVDEVVGPEQPAVAAAPVPTPTPTPTPTPEPEEPIFVSYLVRYYFNNEVNGDKIGPLPGDGNNNNDYHFGDDRYEAYLEDLKDPEQLAIRFPDFTGRYDSEEFLAIWGWADIQDRASPVFTTEDNPEPRGGDALLASGVLVDAFHKFKQESFLPPEISQLPPEEQPDALHVLSCENPSLYESLWANYSDYVEREAVFSIKVLGTYTSQMYMLPNGTTENVPSIIRSNTNNRGGHAIVITTKDGAQELRYECGWQPINIDKYWPSDRPDPPPPPKVPPNPPSTPKDPPPPPTQPKGAKEPTPTGDGYEGRENNSGNPKEKTQPTQASQGTTPIDPNTSSGSSSGVGTVTAPGADPAPSNHTTPSTEQGANPAPAQESSQPGADPPANDGSAGNEDDIP